MAPFTKNGVTRSGKQWKVASGLNADDWSDFGYSPMRRSVMFVIEDSMTKAKGPYREIYLARKEYLRVRAESRGLTVAPAAKIPAKCRLQFISLGHIDQDAKRYMGKRLLRDLWRAWRRAVRQMPEGATLTMPAAENSNAPQGAGEATARLPAKAKYALPPRKLKKAPSGAVSAKVAVPKGQRKPADTKIADASRDAEAAIVTVPKGQPRIAASKNTKAAKAAGRAKQALSAKTIGRVPDHHLEKV
jgi:hypothetical protein